MFMRCVIRLEMVIPIFRVGDPEMIEFKRVLLLSGNHRANYANDFFFFFPLRRILLFRIFSRTARIPICNQLLSFFLFFMIRDHREKSNQIPIISTRWHNERIARLKFGVWIMKRESFPIGTNFLFFVTDHRKNCSPPLETSFSILTKFSYSLQRIYYILLYLSPFFCFPIVSNKLSPSERRERERNESSTLSEIWTRRKRRRRRKEGRKKKENPRKYRV